MASVKNIAKSTENSTKDINKCSKIKLIYLKKKYISKILIKMHWSGGIGQKSLQYFQSSAPIVQIDQREWY